MIGKVPYQHYAFPYPATCFSVRLAASSAVTAQGSAVSLFVGSQGLCPMSSNKSLFIRLTVLGLLFLRPCPTASDVYFASQHLVS